MSCQMALCFLMRMYDSVKYMFKQVQSTQEIVEA